MSMSVSTSLSQRLQTHTSAALPPEPKLRNKGLPRHGRRARSVIQKPENDLAEHLAKIAELNRGLMILRQRMSDSKKELLDYFEQHPELKSARYMVGDQAIRYVDRNHTDGLSQRRVMSGIQSYLRSNGWDEKEIPGESQVIMSHILEQRGRKTVPSIDISHPKSKTGDAGSGSEKDLEDLR